MNQNSYEELECLRELTKLGFIDKMKVFRARKEAEEFRELDIKYGPDDSVDVDYSLADNMEINLRKRALQNKLEAEWKDYIYAEHDGYSLSQYAESTLNQYMEKKQEKIKKLNIKNKKQ